MMMKIAGGPGLVSPLDYGERKRPLPKATWIAVGIVVAAHVGVGAALYYQKFEAVEAAPPPDSSPPFIVTINQPPPPTKPVTNPEPPAPNPPLHATPLPRTPTDTLAAVVTDAPANANPVITLSQPVLPEAPTGTRTEPVAPTRAPAVITSPQWVSRPSSEQMARNYPDRALQAGVGGVASLRCQVLVDGSLTGCAIASETPDGRGFGRAGLALSRYFKMSPRTVDGQAVDGAAVSFNIRFSVPD